MAQKRMLRVHRNRSQTELQRKAQNMRRCCVRRRTAEAGWGAARYALAERTGSCATRPIRLRQPAPGAARDRNIPDGAGETYCAQRATGLHYQRMMWASAGGGSMPSHARPNAARRAKAFCLQARSMRAAPVLREVRVRSGSTAKRAADTPRAADEPARAKRYKHPRPAVYFTVVRKGVQQSSRDRR